LVYFEEWDEPMLSGIAWVSELIEIAGGIDIFADRSAGKSAKERIATAEEIIARRPDIIIGSWSGKKFRPEKRWAAKKIWRGTDGSNPSPSSAESATNRF
jgi:iron complex transport system substrate-binding protein